MREGWRRRREEGGITPGIMGSIGGGLKEEACFMKFCTHVSDMSAPFIMKEMESWNSLFTRLTSHMMLSAAVITGTLWIDCVRTTLSSTPSSCRFLWRMETPWREFFAIGVPTVPTGTAGPVGGDSSVQGAAGASCELPGRSRYRANAANRIPIPSKYRIFDFDLCVCRITAFKGGKGVN